MYGFSVKDTHTLSQSLGTGLLIAASFIPRASLAGETINPTPLDVTSATATAEIALSAILNPITESKAFNKLSFDDQKEILKACSELPHEAARHLLPLLERTVRGTERSALFDRDFFGGRCIDTIRTFAAEKWHPAFEPYRAKILESYLCELACPGELNQSEFGVCGTSLFFDFYQNYPGEAARVVRGLFLNSGKVELLKPGVFLERAPYSFFPDPRGNRTWTEATMMSAFMELANGADEHYCKICDMHYHKDNGAVSYGLGWDQTLAVYRGLYNIPNEQSFNAPVAGDKSQISHYLKTYLPGSLSTAMRWSDAAGASVSSTSIHYTNLLEAGALHYQSFSTVYIDAPSSHRVDVIKVEDGRVHFRNPQGCGVWPDGTELVNPPCRVENQRLGIQSMARAEFDARVYSFLIPQRDKKYPVPVPRTVQMTAGESNSRF